MRPIRKLSLTALFATLITSQAMAACDYSDLKPFANCPNSSLAGIYHPGGVLVNLEGINLSGSHLVKAEMSEWNLTNANLEGADLSDSDLSGARLQGANLKGANLSRVNLSKTRVEIVEAQGFGALTVTEFFGGETSVQLESGADLQGANLENANLEGAVTEGANFAGANLKNATLDNPTYWQAKLQGAKM